MFVVRSMNRLMARIGLPMVGPKSRFPSVNKSHLEGETRSRSAFTSHSTANVFLSPPLGIRIGFSGQIVTRALAYTCGRNNSTNTTSLAVVRTIGYQGQRHSRISRHPGIGRRPGHQRWYFDCVQTGPPFGHLLGEEFIGARKTS